MPAKLDRCLLKVMKTGKYTKDQAYAICVKSTGWKRKKGGGWTNRRPKVKQS
ncbi:MAG: hypothetical protein SVK08_00320 [Halobacteriota archaeon]|nr:hypothetical protein [Halobacteriota archaeon]